MTAKWIRPAVVLLWIVATVWLIRYEAFPSAFTNTVDGYRGLLGEGVLARDAWMKIVFQKTPIGYSHSRIDLNDKSATEYCTVYNRTFLNLRIMGQAEKVSASASAILDNRYRLGRFTFSLSSSGYRAQIQGMRRRGATFHVQIETGGHKQAMEVEIPDDAVLYSPMTEMAMKQLKPGQKMSMKTFDPTSLAVANVTIAALRREPLALGVQTQEVTVLALDYRGLEILSWVDEDGQVLKQETPFGWSLIACEPDEALAVEKTSGGPADILAAMAVPSAGRIEKPRDCRRLRLRLAGAKLEGLLDNPRQTVERISDHEAVVTIVAGGSSGASSAAAPDTDPRHLSATPFIQSDDPRIVRQAREIVRGRTNAVEAATAIYEWVYRNVEKNPAVSLPSAVEVLQRRQGDCNEHTYLFVALARAAGLPAKVVVGLTYARGAFYYHAWPAVNADGWIEMDPTLGQPRVDATHIALLEGEIPDQLKLLQVFGRLKIEVLDQDYAAD